MNWSVKVVTRTPDVVKVSPAASAREATALGRRRIYDPLSRAFLDAALVNRTDMKIGDAVQGPAAIVERETTTIVTASFDAVMQADGCLLLERKERANV